VATGGEHGAGNDQRKGISAGKLRQHVQQWVHDDFQFL